MARRRSVLLAGVVALAGGTAFLRFRAARPAAEAASSAAATTDLAVRPADGPAPVEERLVAAPPEDAPASVAEGDAAVGEPSAREPFPDDVRARLAGFEEGRVDVGALEEEFGARLIEDPRFAATLFGAFEAETEPAKLSFMQNVLAENPLVRNDDRWQDRFAAAAEDAAAPRARRRAALVFLQQAESIRAVRSRLFALAERGGDLRFHALIALKGLPDRRLPDPELAALAGRLAESDPDPELRGLALRIEESPARAATALADPHREVRLQAAQVAASREVLQRALAVEADAEVRTVMELRLGELP